MNLPDLSDDAVIELAREGGVAWIPALSGMRKIVVARLNEQQRQRIATILQQSLPLGKPPGQPDSPGSGDQRFFHVGLAERDTGLTQEFGDGAENRHRVAIETRRECQAVETVVLHRAVPGGGNGLFEKEAGST